MKKLKWGMIGGGEGSQIGPAHRLGAQRTGISNLPPVRWITGPMRAVTMRGGWGLPPTAPMATGRKCWLVKRAGQIGLIW